MNGIMSDSSMFVKFRIENTFIDCLIEISDQQQIKAHRILLSKYSKYFFEYFKSKPFDKSNIIVTLPLLIENDSTFEQIIDSFYSNTITPLENNIMILYGYSIIYGIPQLELELKNKVRNSDIPKLKMLDQANRLLESKHESNLFIEQNIERFISQIAFLLKDIAENIGSYNTNYLINNSPELIFSKILEYCNLTDLQKLELASKFAETRKITSMSNIANIIDFTDEKNFTMPIYINLDWVSPKLQRAMYSKIFANRKKTVDVFARQFSKLQNFNSKINLTLFAWLSTIFQSLGNTTLQYVELVEYLGTCAGLSFNGMYFNPSLYFFTVESSPPLDEDLFSCHNAFDNTDKYFLSQGFTKDSNVFIQISFGSKCFNVKNIEIIYENHSGKNHKQMNSDDFKAIINDGNEEVEVTNIENISKHAKSIKIINNCNTIVCLRVSRIKIYGNFIIDTNK